VRARIKTRMRARMRARYRGEGKMGEGDCKGTRVRVGIKLRVTS
jgi:hypothetical protein